MTTVLLVHNRYQQAGGEDAAVEADAALLERAGHRVVRYERSNDEIAEMGPGAIATAALGTVWSRASRRSLDELIERARPDVVHAHNTFPLISPSIFAGARARGIPVVQTMHNYRLVCASAVLTRDGHVCHDCVGHLLPSPAVVHRCYRGSRLESGVVGLYQTVHRASRTWHRAVTRYLAVSSHLAEVLIGAGAVPRDRVEVRHNVCEPDPGPRHQSADEGLIVWAGRVTREKGIETLVRAASRTVSTRVLVAGDGPDRGDAERLARELGASNVSFLGHLPRAEVLELLRRARCLVFTSAWEEPCPMILIEAAALGVPAIASEIGGVPEIVSPATGVLVAPNDVTALADAIDAATRDPDSWHQLGRAARADYEQRFSSDRSLERLLGAYGRAGVRDR